MNNIEKQLQLILENQLFMQNQINKIQGQMDTMQDQMNKMQGQMDTMQGQMNKMQGKMDTMQGQIDVMDEKIDNNHKEVIGRLDNVEKRLAKLENNQEAVKKFILESDSSFRKSEETYKVIQDLRNVFAKED